MVHLEIQNHLEKRTGEKAPTSNENISTFTMERKQQEKIQEDIFERIENELEQNPNTFIASMVDAAPKKIDSLSREQTNKIIKLFSNKSNAPENLGVVGITSLVQGGRNKFFNGPNHKNGQ